MKAYMATPACEISAGLSVHLAGVFPYVFSLVTADKVCFCEVSEDVHEKGRYGASIHGTPEQGSSSGVYAASGCEICFQDASGNTL